MSTKLNLAVLSLSIISLMGLGCGGEDFEGGSVDGIDGSWVFQKGSIVYWSDGKNWDDLPGYSLNITDQGRSVRATIPNYICGNMRGTHWGNGQIEVEMGTCGTYGNYTYYIDGGTIDLSAKNVHVYMWAKNRWFGTILTGEMKGSIKKK